MRFLLDVPPATQVATPLSETCKRMDKQCQVWPQVMGTVIVSLAFFTLFFTPLDLTGEDFQADGLREHRMTRLQALLESQGTSLQIAEDLARGILLESNKNALDPLLVVAVIQVESQFDAGAVSRRGAQGLMQIRPVVIEELIEQGRISAHEERELTDPIVNVRLGVSYLAHLSDLFGDVELALTAYNWGPTRLKKKIAAKEEMPMHYLTKVLTAQRSLEEQLALIG